MPARRRIVHDEPAGSYPLYFTDGLPPRAVILRDLRACQGNVHEFLRRHAVDAAALLFAINEVQSEAPEFKAEWERIVKLGEELAVQMLHSQLIDKAAKMARGHIEDVGDAIKIIERLSPDTWGRKTAASGKVGRLSKGEEQSRLDTLLQGVNGNQGQPP